MAFIKQTNFAGYKNGEYVVKSVAGHWAVEKIIARAEKMGIELEMVKHVVIDLSGRGRGGHDGLWEMQQGKMVKVENWQEGNRHNYA